MRTVTQRDNRLADKRVAAANHSQRAVVWSCGWQAAANHVVAANTCTWTPECCYSPQRHWHLCICCMLMQTLVGVWNSLKHTNLHTNTDTHIYICTYMHMMIAEEISRSTSWQNSSACFSPCQWRICLLHTDCGNNASSCCTTWKL